MISVRRHDRCDSIERLPAKPFALRGKSPSLLVGQTEPSALHLLFQDAILFYQIVNDSLLVPVHSASDGPE